MAAAWAGKHTFSEISSEDWKVTEVSNSGLVQAVFATDELGQIYSLEGPLMKSGGGRGANLPGTGLASWMAPRW